MHIIYIYIYVKNQPRSNATVSCKCYIMILPFADSSHVGMDDVWASPKAPLDAKMSHYWIYVLCP